MPLDPSAQWKLEVAAYGTEAFEHVRDIRITVFVNEQGYKLQEEMDDYDPQCIHILLLSVPPSGKPIPAGTLRYFPPPKNKVGRVAVMKVARGKGAGGVLLKGLESLLKGEWGADNQAVTKLLDGRKANELQCNAQVPVIPFYKGLGWVTEGDVFQEDGTPHILMRKKLLCNGPES